MATTSTSIDSPAEIHQPTEDVQRSDTPGPNDGAESGTRGWTWGNRWLATTGLIVVALASTLTVARVVLRYQVPGPFDSINQGLCDFHNGLYFPTKALIAGVSPYGEGYVAKYPVARQIPFFSPGILLVHTPMTLLGMRGAEIFYTLLNFVLVGVIATIAVRAAKFPYRVDFIAWISAAVLCSRGGHVTIFNGYFTFELVVATFASIAWAKDSPKKAALALAIVSAKPTYILPLGFLLLARGNFRALIYGAVISVLIAGLPMAWLSWHEGQGDVVEGGRAILAQIAETQEVHRSQFDESPVFSWTRLDLLAVASKWGGFDPGDEAHLIGMFLLLAIPMIVLFCRARAGLDDGLGGITGALILVASLVSVYHQSYDALLMVVPAATILGGRNRAWNQWPIPLRAAAVTLACFPAYNLLSTRFFLLAHEPSLVEFCIVTSLSGLALASLLGLLVVAGWVNVGRSLPAEQA